MARGRKKGSWEGREGKKRGHREAGARTRQWDLHFYARVSSEISWWRGFLGGGLPLFGHATKNHGHFKFIRRFRSGSSKRWKEGTKSWSGDLPPLSGPHAVVLCNYFPCLVPFGGGSKRARREVFEWSGPRNGSKIRPWLPVQIEKNFNLHEKESREWIHAARRSASSRKLCLSPACNLSIVDKVIIERINERS